MAHILIVGQNFAPLKEYLLTHNHTYTLLQDILKTKFPDKRFKNRVVADFSSEATILSSLKLVKKPIDAAISVYENYIVPTAMINQFLNLSGLPVDSALACTDKYRMRSLFALAPEKISPAFARVSTLEDVQSFAAEHSFPLILKPANLAKSLLVTKSTSMSELVDNFAKTIESIDSTYKKYAPNQVPSLIIEEYLDGTIHSVDAFVDQEGNPMVLDSIVDYQTGYDIGYDDNFHYSRTLPTKLTAADQKALLHCAEVGIRSLGMKNTPAHVEIIMTKVGPRIVEIGARNGGYRERMYRLANGIDTTGLALGLALGTTTSPTILKREPVAVLELFPKIPGIFKGVSHEDMLQRLPSLNYYSVKATPGKFVGKSGNGFKMTAIVILHNSDVEQFNTDLKYISQNCRVVTSSEIVNERS